MYLGTSLDKSYFSSLTYISLSPSCNHTSEVTPDMGGNVNGPSSTPNMGSNQVQLHSASRSSCDPQGVKRIYFPKMVLTLLKNPHAYKLDNKGGSPGTMLLMADTGATDHKLSEKSTFILYYPVVGLQVRMGNNSISLIHGYGSAIISLNEKKILIRDCLHVPNLKDSFCTVSVPISASMDVASLECTAWVSTCSFLHLSSKWTWQPPAIFTTLQLVIQRASQNSTTSNRRFHIRRQLLLHQQLLRLQPLLNRTTMTTTMIQATSHMCPIGLNAPLHRPQWQLTSTQSLQRHSPKASAKLLFPDTAPTGLSPPNNQPKRNASDCHVCMEEKDIIALLHKSDSSLPPIRPCDPRTHQVQNHTGWSNNYTASPGVNNFGIIST
jgi:hypothetical protein